MRRRLVPALTTLLAALAAAAPAGASTTQESMFQDDPLLVYGSPEQQLKTLDRAAQLGVDRLRVSVFWDIVAPDPESRTKPAGFDAKNPEAYPAGAWDRYDRLLRAARQRGIAVNFNVTAPGPLWAMGDPGDRPDLADVWTPSPKEFGEFVVAVGRRYSGEVPGIPRVDYWSIWNEPNQGAWLAPQWSGTGTGAIELSPKVYRPLVDAAWAALSLTGHGKDTILVGETAPKGSTDRGPSRPLSPRRFLLRLYCLDDNGQFLRAEAATALDCPVEDQAARMRAEHPGLFGLTGWAHHPYEVSFAPTRQPTLPESFTTANLRQLSSLLRRVFLRMGAPVPAGGGSSGFPLYLTEYGYQTDPPDPLGVSNAEQAAYLNQAEWLTSQMTGVKALAQFLMVDDKPGEGASPTERFGATFQSGLITLEGRKKPGYAAYRLPIHVRRTRVRKGRKLPVWGLVRPGKNGQRQTVRIEVRAGSKGAWKRVRTVKTEARRGYFAAGVTVRRSGAVRYAWTDPATKRAAHSRTVAFRVR
ncbi:hypothetical protein [Conexibacter sp. SYSU D00693]|uniref:hypothetical protein n=1 Tax=Conexibacter sp. SYSU D00693 TaxID=2812560 RepID=UPI00196B6C94|nr:hypothetical protein [Conexibacter sp. SYSU D00693]